MARLADSPDFRLIDGDIASPGLVAELVEANGVRRIVHLAAQAGVRYSLENPFAYEHSNLKGHLAVLEAVRHASGVEHLVYASSSSRSEEHTSELQSLMRISYAVFCLKKKKKKRITKTTTVKLLCKHSQQQHRS